jgi:putative spermidine/putrescine transport system permease protein
MSAPHTPLRRALRRAERGRQLKAVLLVLPLLAFLGAVFVAPIATTLFKSVSSPEVSKVLPASAAMLIAWDGRSPPDEAMAAVFIPEIAQAYAGKTIAGAATRFNEEQPGLRSTVMKAARAADTLAPPYLEALVALDPDWAGAERWRHLKAAASPYTARYLLSVLDLRQDGDGGVSAVPPDQALYLDYLKRTLSISLSVTVLSILIGYPVAYFAAHARPVVARIVLACVLLPFWISVLVRTAAWMTLLQKEGIVNSVMLRLGLIDTPVELIFNRLGVYIAMVHVLLPFVVLPTYNVMRTIPAAHVMAALSMGARPFAAFRTVYLPQSLPGVSAGALLVFILALGYYITPALVGGAQDQMLSYLITQFALNLGNWGMASAAAGLLLLTTFLCYFIFRKAFGARGFTV